MAAYFVPCENNGINNNSSRLEVGTAVAVAFVVIIVVVVMVEVILKGLETAVVVTAAAAAVVVVVVVVVVVHTLSTLFKISPAPLYFICLHSVPLLAQQHLLESLPDKHLFKFL